MNILKRLFSVALLLAAIVTLPACNTMEGAGRDIERAGDKIEDAAD